MTPNELYAREPERVDDDLNVLAGCYYNFLEELQGFDNYGVFINREKNTRVDIRYYKDFDFDGRRFWRLASVWYEGQPVMIFQNAGREGDDHTRRIITDLPRFHQMIRYIGSELMEHQTDESVSDVYDPDKEVEGLTDFYGNSLDGYFERHY